MKSSPDFLQEFEPRDLSAFPPECDLAQELVHIDSKRLVRCQQIGYRIHGERTRRSRRAGFEHLHVGVDDATRLAYTELLETEDAASATGFLRRASGWFSQLGVRIERVMTDNAFAHTSPAYRAALRELGARHLRTRPYRPRTNGKGERLIQTCLREWAYRRAYRASTVRAAALPTFIRRYNVERPDTSLQRRPPLARLLELSEQRAQQRQLGRAPRTTPVVARTRAT